MIIKFFADEDGNHLSSSLQPIKHNTYSLMYFCLLMLSYQLDKKKVCLLSGEKQQFTSSRKRLHEAGS